MMVKTIGKQQNLAKWKWSGFKKEMHPFDLYVHWG